MTVSFDPLETHQLAALKRQSYLAEYGRPKGGGGWAFLTGRKKSIDPLLNATGFHVKWNERQQQWVHVAALILCTPEGRISRYLRNVAYDPQTLRLALVEASEGKIGTTMDQLLLFCCAFDPNAGSYAIAAWNVTRLVAVLTLVMLVGLLLFLWSRERRGRRKPPEAMSPTA